MQVSASLPRQRERPVQQDADPVVAYPFAARGIAIGLACSAVLWMVIGRLVAQLW